MDRWFQLRKQVHIERLLSDAARRLTSGGEKAQERREVERIFREKQEALSIKSHVRIPSPPSGWFFSSIFFSVIMPDESISYMIWKFGVMIMVLLNLIYIPYCFAFGDLSTPRWLDGSELLFAADLILSCRVAYLDRGMVITNTKEITLRYIQSACFAFDLLSCLPLFDPIDFVLGTKFNWCRLLKVPAVIAYHYRFELYSERPYFARLLRLVTTMVLCFHLVACAYITLSYAEGFGSTAYVLSEEFLAGNSKHSEVYLRAFYWATSLLLSNPIAAAAPERRREIYFQMGLDLLSVIIFAAIVGEISTLISEWGARANQHRQKMSNIHEFLLGRALPRGLTYRIKNYFDYLWSRQQGINDQEILDELPHHLRTEVLLYMHRDLLQRVHLFEGCDVHFFATLAGFLKPQIYSPGDYVITFGDVGDEMYFLARGAVQVINVEGKVVAELSSGSYFGEIALFTTEKRTASVRAVTYCDVLTLSREAFDYVIAKFPTEGELIKTVGNRRLLSDKKTSLLKKLPLFMNSSNEFAQALVSELSLREVSSGEFVIRESDTNLADEMYFVSKGLFEVLNKDGDVLTTIGEGGFFGEIALLYNTPRSASVRALKPSELFVLRRKDFEKVLEKYPSECENIQRTAEERKNNQTSLSSSSTSSPFLSRQASTDSMLRTSSHGVDGNNAPKSETKKLN